MALPYFTPSAYASTAAVYGASSRVALPGGGGPALLITNLGPSPVVALLGDSTVAVTLSTGVVIPAGQAVALGVGSNTHLAIIGTQASSILNLAQGT